MEVEEQTGSCSGEGNANTGLEERVGSVTIYMSSVIPAVVKQPPTVKGGIMHLHGNRGLHSSLSSALKAPHWEFGSCCGTDTVKVGGATGKDSTLMHPFAFLVLSVGELSPRPLYLQPYKE